MYTILILCKPLERVSSYYMSSQKIRYGKRAREYHATKNACAYIRVFDKISAGNSARTNSTSA